MNVERVQHVRSSLNKKLALRPAWYCLIISGAMLVAFVVQVRLDGIFACQAGDYNPNHYLALCMGDTYGEYDHGAFWFGLEPELEQSLTTADVLILGNSRMQAGFSAQATEQWFSSPSISYFMLGFSWNSTVEFIEPILDRVRPRPRVVIINVDQFFSSWRSPLVEDVLSDRVTAAQLARKKYWQPVHQFVCGLWPDFCGSKLAYFRSRENGSWRRNGFHGVATVEVSVGEDVDRESWYEYGETAEQFVKTLPVDRDCIILTVVPYPQTNRGEVIAVARALGARLYLPSMKGLTTFDGSHLDQASSERWAADFFNQAGAQIKRCLDQPGAQSA